MCAAACNAPGPDVAGREVNDRRSGRSSRCVSPYRVWLAAALCLVLTVAGPGPAQANTAAQTSVARLVSALDALSAQPGLSDKVLAARFGDIAARHFDLAVMARDTLGADTGAIPRPLWRKFVSAYGKHLQAAFVSGMRRHGASMSKVLGSRTAPNGLPVIVTRINIGGRTRDTVWFMCRQNTLRICDIGIDGVRASARQRSAFRPVLMREGPDAFVSRLAEGGFATQGDLQP